MLDSFGEASRRPVLWVAVGRQRVGKTTVLSAAAQFFRARGAEIDVWNGDQQNRSNALSSYFLDAQEVPPGSFEDGRQWVAARIDEQVHSGRSAVLDIGGGLTAFSSLVEEMPLAEGLSEAGITVVGLFVVGPEQADLDYLQQFAETGHFMPPASVIVLNGGLVTSGRSLQGAFDKTMKHAVVQAAAKRGTRVITFPNLGCLSVLTDQHLGYADALANRLQPGQRPLGFLDRLRVRRWWGEALPAFLGQFPQDWLPFSERSVAPTIAGETV